MSEAAGAETRSERTWPVLLAAGCAFLILVALGTWQLERRAWKIGLIAQVESRVAAPARPLPPPAGWASLTRAGNEYAHVTVTGTFDHGRETLIYTVADGEGPSKGPGFLVITPLRLTGGGTVLVNRGFVPDAARDPAARSAGQVAGAVTITGLLRFAEEASYFVPANDPARNGWYRRDPAQIAAARGLADVAPFLIDADGTPNPGGLPQGGGTRLAFPNRHLEYALTWYGLAAALVGVTAAYLLLRRRAAGAR